MPYKDTATKRAREKKWRKEHPAETAAHLRQHRYRLSDFAYNRLCDQQGFSYKICRTVTEDATGKGKTLHVDHDAKTRKVRGLLCAECNMGLGKFQHSIQRMQSAIQYLLDTQ
jgi:Recombination endonuclease VII